MTAYVIWNRVSRSFVGGSQPIVFTQSADATAHAALIKANEQNPPKPIFDVVSVTVT